MNSSPNSLAAKNRFSDRHIPCRTPQSRWHIDFNLSEDQLKAQCSARSYKNDNSMIHNAAAASRLSNTNVSPVAGENKEFDVSTEV